MTKDFLDGFVCGIGIILMALGFIALKNWFELPKGTFPIAAPILLIVLGALFIVGVIVSRGGEG
ncbi:MAG: hypothetical protein DRN81_03715 [Thermoproteota archaeon]|nr:MAG: hypothetical protein DRN81_03715 [Candidatus Korarchaeota archaeon]